jgi:hypothetical protein
MFTDSLMPKSRAITLWFTYRRSEAQAYLVSIQDVPALRSGNLKYFDVQRMSDMQPRKGKGK